MPSDSASESKTLAESAEIGEIGDRSGRLQDAGCLKRRDGEIEVDRSDVKVSTKNVEDRSSGGVDISGGSGILEKDATSSENLQDVEKLESKGGSVEEIGDQTLGRVGIGVGSEIVKKYVTFIERRRSESLQDEHKLGEEVEVMAIGSEVKIGEEIVVESDIGKETVDGQRGFVQVGVVEIHSGSDVVEKGVSCLEKSEDTVNDEIARNSLESDDREQVEVAVIETAVGQEDEVSQAPELHVMDHDCDHKDSISQNENIREEVSVASESVAVDDSVKLEEANDVKEPYQVDSLEEEQMNELGDGSMMRGDQETSASHASLVGTDQKICESKLSDETAHNSLYGQALAAEISDQGQEKVGAESSAGQGDIGEHKSLEINQAPELEVVGSEDEMGGGSVMKHGCDRKDSTSKKILAAGDQRSHEAGNATLDFIAVDDSTKLPETGVEKDSNANDPVKEAKLQLAESVNEDVPILSNDQEEATVSHASSMDIDQNISDEDKEAEAQVPVVDDHQKIQEEDSCSLESAPVDDINCHQVRGSAEMDMDAVIYGNRGKEPKAYVQEESDSILDPVPVDSMVHQEDRVEKGPNPDVCVVEEHADLMDKQTQAENAIESLVCGDHQGNDPEASVPETSFEKTNQSFEEKGESLLVPVLVDTVANQADSVVENPNFTEPAAEAEAGDESVLSNDQEEASVSRASSMDIDQNISNEDKEAKAQVPVVDDHQKIQEEDSRSLESAPVDDINCHQLRGSAEMDMDAVIDGNRGKELEAYVQKESDSILDPVPVDSMIHQEDRVGKGPNPDVCVVKEHADLMDKQTQAENAIESLVCGDHQGNDPEASVPETSFEKTNQSFQEKGESLLGPVRVDSVANQADSVGENPYFTEPAAETEVGDESVLSNDQEEATVSRASSMDIDQNISDEDKEAEAQVPVVVDHQKIQEEDSCSLESAPVDDINCHQVRGIAEMDMDAVIDGNRGKELKAYVQEESDSILDPDPVDSMVHQEDRVEKGTNPDVCVVEEHADLMDKQTQAENAIESLVCGYHQGNDPEASVPEMSFEKTNQSFQEKGESLLGPVFVDSVANQADSVVENPNFTERAAEAEVGDESVMDGSEGKDHKASSSEMFLLETNQKLQENQDTPLAPVPVDNTMNEQASHVEAPNLADPVVESQSQIVLNEVVAGHVEAPNFADPAIESQPQIMLNEAVAGHVDAPNLADPFVGLQPQVVLKEAFVGDESLLHADKEMDFDTSVSQAPFVDHQETGNETFASKTSLDVDAQNIHEDYILEAPNLADHAIEIPPLSDQVMEAPNLADHVIEAPPLSDQVTEVSNLPDHVTESPTLVDQVMEAPYLADEVLEPQPQLALNKAVVGDKSPLDVDKETDNNTSVSHTSFMENQVTNNESSAAKSSLVDNDQNIPKENDAMFGSVLAGCTTHHQSDNAGEFSIAADTVVDKQSRLSGRETKVGDNSMRNVDQGKDQEASDLPMSLVVTNENIQQESSLLDLVILNGTLNHEADTVTEGSIPINSVEEQSHVIGAETKVGDGSIANLDQHGNYEDSQSNMSLEDHTIGHPGDHIAKDLNPADVVAESIEEADEKHEILGSVDVRDMTVDGSTDRELTTQGGKEKSLKQTKKKVIRSVAAICDQHVSYHLPLEKANFSFSDLVWGKVKSHPWWPGQIFDPSDASKLAMKYQKKDSFLVAYYGDKTFAWCDESQLKPFHSYFSQMEKLCSSETFVKAIHDILVEVSRRVDLGMACSCLPEEFYTDIKHQKVENAGIKGGIINSVIDRPTVANYFQPDKLLQYIETLAQFPNGKVDRLEFLIVQSQLQAFYRSKGYCELPVFTFSGGVMESVAENPPSSAQELEEDRHCTPTPPKGQSSISKREHGSKDDGKRKNISKRSEYRVAVHIVIGGERKSVTKAAEKSILCSSGKKHIVVESDPVDSGKCKKRMLDSFDDMELKSPSPTTTSSFKIGEFIRRAASQLTGAPPILKCQGETLKKHDVAGFDDVTGSPVENQKINLSFTEDYNSTDEMLSQLCLAAKDPMNEYNFVSRIVAFLTEFRDFGVSSFSEDKEHVEKRKRGRPKKVISQKASSDISLSEDEKHAEKRKRVVQMKNIISQLASSDVSSEDEKLVEKRKRGRPRRNPNPASSDSSEDKNPIQKLQRYIPNKVNSQLAPNEKRKRGRPRKVHADSVLSNTCNPDHTKDSYWSDMDLQKERNNKNQILKQYKRRKSTGEQSLSHPSTPMSYIEQQLQLVTRNPNMKQTFVAERSIISVDEKIVDECMPAALILSFNNANSIPSETDLIRIFSRYGPLKEAETDVLRKTNRAKVVFKRRVDAETAFSSAGKYSIFGPGLLSYQLKPWTPKSILQATPQGSQDVAPVATPQENHDAEPIATAQGNQDVAFIAAPQDIHGSVLITVALDDHDIAPITMAEDNHYAASINTQNKCDVEPTIGSNLQLSEQEEAVLASDPMEVEAEGIKSSPQGKHDAEHQDEEPSVSPLDELDLTPNITQDNLNAASIITLQGICNKEPNKGINLDFSEAMIFLDTVEVETVGKESSPQDKHDPSLITTPQQNQDETLVASPQKNHDAAPLVTLHEKCNEGPTVRSSLEISEQAEDAMEIGAEGKESSPQDKHGQDIQDVEFVTSLLDQHNLTPAIIQDNLDAASISTLQEKCDEGPIAGSNLEISEQAVSYLMEVDAEDKDSLPQDEVDQDKEEDEPVAPPLDEHDITPTAGQDNLDPPSIIPLLDKCNAGPIVGTSLELSEQNEALEVEAEGKKLLPPDRHNLENEDKELVTSPLDEHDLTPTTTRDNIEASPIIMPRDTCDAVLAEGSNLEVSEQAKSGMTRETMQTKAGGNNLEVSEQGEPSTASDTMQVEGK